jgi:hypothetical protein
MRREIEFAQKFEAVGSRVVSFGVARGRVVMLGMPERKGVIVMDIIEYCPFCGTRVNRKKMEQDSNVLSGKKQAPWPDIPQSLWETRE